MATKTTTLTGPSVEVLLTAKLRQQEQLDRATHEPSGRLSASSLSKPLLEQVLRVLGIPTKPTEDYTLRLFARGKQVEQMACELLDGDEQVEAHYRGAFGLIDKVLPDGTPVEIKSVKNSQWKWLDSLDKVNSGYKLQAAFYALATGKPSARLVMICADDFRIREFDVPTEQFAPVIDQVISEVAAQLKKGVLPEFEAREDWHNKPEYSGQYSQYPDWVGLPQDLLMQKLQAEFPDAYKRLRGFATKETVK